MSISRIRGAGNASGAASVSVTLGGAVSAGDLLIVTIGNSKSGGGTISSVGDNLTGGGNTYSSIKSVANNPNLAAIYATIVTVTGSPTITVTMASTGNFTAVGYGQYRSTVGFAGVTADGANSGSSASGTTYATGTCPVSGNDLVVGAITGGSTGSITLDTADGFSTNYYQAPGAQQGLLDCYILNQTSSVGATQSISSGWCAVIASWKEMGGAAGGIVIPSLVAFQEFPFPYQEEW